MAKVKEERRDNTPTVTKKWHIEVPVQTYASVACVYKVWFGKSYFIWKGKALLQSAKQLAESIERYLRLQKDEPTDFLYHVCAYIKRTRCTSAKVEVMDTEFIKEGTQNAIDVYKLLKLEQRLLNEAKGDTLCLNNNQQAYISRWMEEEHRPEVNRFLKNWNK